MLVNEQLDYLNDNLCWAVSAPGGLTTVSNINLKAELGERLVVKTGDGSKELNKKNILRIKDKYLLHK